jgi:PTS system mannose-specific IIA component
MKLGVVVVTHGQLSTELVNSAEMIVGDLPHFAAVAIGWHEDVDRAREEIGRAIERVQATLAQSDAAAGATAGPAQVLVLTDMFGGTPTNLAVTYVSPDVEVITGVNLPMLIKLARPQPGLDRQALAGEMREHGRNAIWVASELLKGQKT